MADALKPTAPTPTSIFSPTQRPTNGTLPSLIFARPKK